MPLRAMVEVVGEAGSVVEKGPGRLNACPTKLCIMPSWWGRRPGLRVRSGFSPANRPRKLRGGRPDIAFPINNSSFTTAQIAVAPANVRSPIRSLTVAALFKPALLDTTSGVSPSPTGRLMENAPMP